MSAITTTEGPVLITAGPGTGKTFTLVKRAVYLIEAKSIQPEQIFMATFTEKAAKEIVTRITNELAKRNISINLNEMYIGTFHSICLQIINDYLEYSTLKKNYRLLDDFDQKYSVFQNIYKFRNLSSFDVLAMPNTSWQQAERICFYVNTLSEELITASALQGDSNPEVRALGDLYAAYTLFLEEENLLDFSTIQTAAYKLLKNNPRILDEIQTRISYFMIDEYQDTNYIQEQIVFLLGNATNNICVVGDDDQGLYRFRGATIRNILEFPSRFERDTCKVINLDINYRSNSDIVDFYNKWMRTTSGRSFRFLWDRYRYDKEIIPQEKTSLDSPAVVSLLPEGGSENWHKDVLKIIKTLKRSGKLVDYNQIAFLFSSVKHKNATGLAKFLENNGINVYSPRAKMYFLRDEIMLLIGFLLWMFPVYFKKLEEDSFDFLQMEDRSYYLQCIKKALEVLEKPEAEDLLNWIKKRGMYHSNLQENTDYSYNDLIYRLFEFSPLKDILATDLSGDVVDERPSRNIALFTQIVRKFEYLHRVDVFEPKKIHTTTEKFFNLYLRLLLNEGLFEYEDDSEYAPSGCVSFLTIHQSKGMEFPIVFVDSLYQYPRNATNDLLFEIEEKYYHRPTFEPKDSIKFFDFWRLYYTAFSRAQNLLILTSPSSNRSPSKYFRKSLVDLNNISLNSMDFDEFEFETVKDVMIKQSFSFVSNISVYETCSLQYKFYKELQFAPVRVSAILFGMLVHQTIEDIHKAALRNEEHLITTENIESWFDINYSTLSKNVRIYLGEPQKKAALNQVLRYK
ncbi:MAG: ATP-dependent helicase, partial [Clostridiaceae bacterium]|nr:ATP-dependent helicase [Clostridiaceae bacterium]